MTYSERVHEFTLQQLNNACSNCTSFFIRKGKDEEGDTTYQLVDGCGDDYQDPFYDLFDVQDYITNNEQVQEYLVNHA